MKSKRAFVSACVGGLLLSVLAVLLAGCSAEGKGDPREEAPPPAEVEHVHNAGLFKVDDPS